MAYLKNNKGENVYSEDLQIEFGMKKSYISEILIKLEKEEYIIRVLDRRRKKIYITRKGEIRIMSEVLTQEEMESLLSTDLYTTPNEDD